MHLVSILKLAILLCLIGLICGGIAHGATIDEVLVAIQEVETGGEPDGGRNAIGDNGMARGPLQISHACWVDSGISGKWEDCHDIVYARRVAIAYWSRYCREALESGDAERLSRVWNGGPRGHRKDATLRYWIKVQAALSRRL